MTEDAARLAEIQERLAKATPGPWRKIGVQDIGHRGMPHWGVTSREDGLWPDVAHAQVSYDGYGNGSREHDADLIANAPADLGFLMDRLGEANDVNEELLAELAKAQQENEGFSAINDRWLIAYEALNAEVTSLRTALEAGDRINRETIGKWAEDRAALEGIAALHDEREDMARALWHLTPTERAARDKCRPGPESGENARAMFIAHGSPMRCAECNKPAPCPTARSFTASRPTPAPEMAQSVFPAPHYGRTVPLDDSPHPESGAGE